MSRLFAFSGQCLPLVVFFCLHIVDLKYSPLLLWHWHCSEKSNQVLSTSTNSSCSGLSQLPQVPTNLWSPIKVTACGGHMFRFIQLQYCIHTKYLESYKISTIIKKASSCYGADKTIICRTREHCRASSSSSARTLFTVMNT